MEEGPKLRKVIILPDLHIPYHIPLGGILKFIKRVRPTHLLLLGDFIDVGAFWGWHKRKSIDDASLEVQKALETQENEYTAANKVLDDLDAVTPVDCSKVYFTGNHELRLIRLQKKAPDIKDEEGHSKFDFIAKMQLRQRGYKVIPYNSYEAIGHCRYVHGHYCCQHHAKKHIEVFMRPIRYGHTHTVQVYTKISALDGRTYDSASIGTLSDTNPEYRVNSPSAWRHAFEYQVVEPTGLFHSYIIPINAGRFFFGTTTKGEPIKYEAT